jgi:hypothetical protein
VQQLDLARHGNADHVVRAFVETPDPGIGAECQVKDGEGTKLPDTLGQREPLVAVDHTHGFVKRKGGAQMFKRMKGRPVVGWLGGVMRNHFRPFDYVLSA